MVALPAAFLTLAHVLGEDNVRLVGGTVRDMLLGLPAHDIDVATTLLPEQVSERLQAANMMVIPTGLEHGTVTAVVNGVGIEITTLRRDVAPDGRHSAVEFVTEWQVDSLRRDFTFNALYMDAAGRVYDYHHGQADLTAKRVRFIGDAVARVREDYLRILRYFRFAARMETSAAAMKETSAILQPELAGLTQLSAERITMELQKIITTANPAAALQVMRDIGVFQTLELKLDPSFRWEDTLTFVPFSGRWFAVFGRQKNAHIRLSRAEENILKTMTHAVTDVARYTPPALAVATSREAAQTALILAGRLDDAAQLEGITLPTFPLSGQDALAAGMAAGPAMGKALNAVKEWWLTNNCTPSKGACVERLKA
ncbi:MAG: CCA tRNA nucleotidyltransferase [Alphaproteobacteria bacterium]